MYIHKTSDFNSRICKQYEIMLIIKDGRGLILNAIMPGIGSHRQALDWANWRSASLLRDYPAMYNAVLYCGDMCIATFTID